ncbi:MAG: 50S ribosomal protein L24 [Flavobacteriales bacterium]|nr:50S ribosomal protein L24 [Flavobacteriales bacterium]
MGKLSFKKGETVKVITGEDRGKQGRILSVLISKDRAIVEGLNMVSKHSRPSAQNQQGGIVKQEASIHASNLMLVDPATGEATKVGRKLDAKGKLARYSKKTGEFIK